MEELETLRQRVKQTLESAFPGSEAELDPLTSDQDLIGGALLWDDFDDLDHLDRQRRLKAVERAHFTPEEMQRITLIFTVTSDEMAALRDE